MDRPLTHNPFPPPPRQLGKTLLFFSVALVALAGCGYLIWTLVAPESATTLSAPQPAAAAQSEIATMCAQLGFFQKSVGRYPTAAEGLEALVQRPSALAQETPWPRLRTSVPRDPWGRPYLYEELPENPPRYRVSSRGQNADDPADDIAQILPAITDQPAATPAPAQPAPVVPKFR